MAADNVTNGFARMIDGKTNAWAADPKAAGPHWVELSWPKPRKFNMVYVSFQTKDLAPKAFRVKVLPEGLSGTSADDWKTVPVKTAKQHRRHEVVLDAKALGNFASNNTASTNTAATKLRVELDEPAGICEIRVYNEPDRVLRISRRAMANRDLPDAKPQLGWDDSVLWVTGIDPRRLPGIVVDDTRAEQQGRWPTSDFSRPFVGVGYCHDGNRDKGNQSMRFVATLPKPGRYEVRLAYRAVANRASNVPVTIHTTRARRRSTSTSAPSRRSTTSGSRWERFPSARKRLPSSAPKAPTTTSRPTPCSGCRQVSNDYLLNDTSSFPLRVAMS